MEFSKLTICRQDVIVVSDTDSEIHEINSKQKRKHKRKPQCIRNVKLTTMTINRIVPYCFRQKCRYSQHNHRQTSMNTKYHKREKSPMGVKYEKSEASNKDIQCKSRKHDNVDMVINRDLYSPITVASSDTYENVSLSSFKSMSSDSDELEDLIYSTRQRMKNDSDNFNCIPIRKYVCASTTQDDYQNISSDDDILNSSVHSMDTVLLGHGETMAPNQRSPEHLSEDYLQHNNNNNNNVDPTLMYKGSKQDTNKLLQQKSTLTTENNNNLSPMYEISGKVFMEHYLNTSFI